MGWAPLHTGVLGTRELDRLEEPTGRDFILLVKGENHPVPRSTASRCEPILKTEKWGEYVVFWCSFQRPGSNFLWYKWNKKINMFASSPDLINFLTTTGQWKEISSCLMPWLNEALQKNKIKKTCGYSNKTQILVLKNFFNSTRVY